MQQLYLLAFLFSVYFMRRQGFENIYYSFKFNEWQ